MTRFKRAAVRSRLALAFLALLSQPGIAAAGLPGVSTQARAGIGYDGNPANAESSEALPGTEFGFAAVTADHPSPVGRYLVLGLRARLEGEQYLDYVGLSNVKATGAIQALWRPNNAFFTPAFAIWGSAAGWDFRSRMRSGAEYRLGLSVSERLTTAIDVQAGADIAQRSARAQTFDLHGNSWHASAGWRLAGAWHVRLGYDMRYGEFASSIPPDPATAEHASAHDVDDALRTAAGPETAYRERGRTQSGTLGLSYRFSPRLSFDAQVQKSFTRANFGDRYQRTLGELAVSLNL
jgi:hypothetical protein